MRDGLAADMAEPRLGWRVGLTLALGAGFLALLADRLRDLDIAAVMAAATAVSPLAFAASAIAVWVSFWAVGRYDGALHRHLGTGVPARTARRAGLSPWRYPRRSGSGW
ncbi:MAG: hypothetical protein HC844_21595 [Tabrizicola sp.]|nr:hypothetical protein [Tabrizicola sp.]